MKKFISVLLLALAGCGSFYTVPTAQGGAPKSKPIEFSAWLVFWDPLSLESFKANVTRLNRVYPESYTCMPDGLPVRLPNVTAGLAQVLPLAHEHGLKVLGTMNNYASELGDFEKKRVQKFLHDSALMERHVDALLALAKEDGLDGLDVDYESLDGADRGAFTAFVQRLSTKAHATGMLVGIAVHPKESEPGVWAGPQAQDYAALGAAVDFFRPMTYDYHWGSGSPGAVAPLNWVRSVAQFTASKVPKEKIELGLNGYGYAWTPKGETLTWPKYLALQQKFGRFERDPSSNELTMTMPNGEAWYSDAETSRPKFEVTSELGLRGMAMWVLGQEDPKTWKVLDEFNAKAAK
jgi:spore germination protein